MGVGVPRGRPPSHIAYYIALAGILFLLLLLITYFFYFCIKRVKQLSRQGLPEPVQSVRPPPPGTVPYPVQPVVRSSASAMARLCQSPSSPRAFNLAVKPSQANRSASLTPTHTDTVHPSSRPNRTNTLPPPTIINQPPPTSRTHRHNIPKSPTRKKEKEGTELNENSISRIKEQPISNGRIPVPPQIVVGNVK